RAHPDRGGGAVAADGAAGAGPLHLHRAGPGHRLLPWLYEDHGTAHANRARPGRQVRPPGLQQLPAGPRHAAAGPAGEGGGVGVHPALPQVGGGRTTGVRVTTLTPYSDPGVRPFTLTLYSDPGGGAQLAMYCWSWAISSCWSSITAFTRSPIETRPTTRPFSSTGRWRMRRVVIRPLQVWAVSVGDTVTTWRVMICATGVSAEERPCRITLRA